MQLTDIPLNKLHLDSENPRLDRPAEDSRAAFVGLIQDDPNGIVSLACSIAAEGLDPSQSLIVMRAPSGDAYTVLEGNRRLTALNLLHNPDLGDGILSASQKRKLKKSAGGRTPLDQVRCVIAPTREAADGWLERRHTGRLSGEGLAEWSPRQKARFRRRLGDNNATLEVYEFVRDHGELTEDQRQALRESAAFTNIERMIDDAQVRTLLGVEVRKGRVYTALGRDEVIKGLRRLVLNGVEGKFDSRSMNKTDQRQEYVRGFAPNDLPSRDAALGEPVLLVDAPETRGPMATDGAGSTVIDSSALAEVTVSAQSDIVTGGGQSDIVTGGATPDGSADALPRRTPGTRKSVAEPVGTTDGSAPDAPSSVKRKYILGGSLHVPEPPRVNAIYEELGKLDINRVPNAAAVLFRVFFELSVDRYCEKHGVQTTREGRGGRRHAMNLRAKFEAVCDHLELTGGKDAADKLKPIRLEMGAGAVLLGNIDTLHQYVHNRAMTPTPTELRAAGDKAHPFFQLIWPYTPNP